MKMSNELVWGRGEVSDAQAALSFRVVGIPSVASPTSPRPVAEGTVHLTAKSEQYKYEQDLLYLTPSGQRWHCNGQAWTTSEKAGAF